MAKVSRYSNLKSNFTCWLALIPLGPHYALGGSTNFKLPYLKTLAFPEGAQHTCLKAMPQAADCATYLAVLVE